MHKSYFLLLTALFFGLSFTANAQSLAIDSGNATALSADTDSPFGQNGGIVITQNEDFGLFSGGVRCGSAAGGYSTENSFYRVFDLSEVAEITDGLAVTKVSAGIAIAAWPEDTPTQTGFIRLYTLAAAPVDGVFLAADLELVSEQSFEIDGPADTFILQEVDIAGNFAPDDLMAVEMFLPTGDPATNTELTEPFSISQAGNDLGVTANEYLASESCVITDPTDITTLGDFASEWVLVVEGINSAGQASEEGAVPESLSVNLYPNPVTDTARLEIKLDTQESLTVAVYDVAGREIATLHEGAIAGQRSVELDAAAFTSGTYIVQVRGESFSTTHKFFVVR